MPLTHQRIGLNRGDFNIGPPRPSNRAAAPANNRRCALSNTTSTTEKNSPKPSSLTSTRTN